MDEEASSSPNLSPSRKTQMGIGMTPAVITRPGPVTGLTEGRGAKPPAVQSQSTEFPDTQIQLFRGGLCQRRFCYCTFETPYLRRMPAGSHS